MRKAILLIFTLSLAIISKAQIDIPLRLNTDDEGQLIKETDSGKYYHASGDGDRVVFLGEDPLVYRLLTKERKTIVEGSLSSEADSYAREGKWVEYFDNGLVKITGYYYKNKPTGMWQKYYPSGKIMAAYTYGLVDNEEYFSVLIGSYTECFENGRIRVNGLYKASLNPNNKDSIYVEDAVTGEQVLKTVPSRKPKSEKIGSWEYYSENGELMKKEEYH